MLTAVLAGAALASCADRGRGAVIDEAREGIMGTRVEVSVWVPPDSGREIEARAGIREAFAVAIEVERRMSPRDPASTVSVLNDGAGGDPVAIDDMTWDVLVGSIAASEMTDGAFDPTWASLDGLWDFTASGHAPPTVGEVRARLDLVGWEGLVLDPSSRTAMLGGPGMQVGLGGIAKGYALDLMAAALRKRGIVDFVCDAGGDLVVAGRKGDEPWVVGLRHPRKRDGLLARFPVGSDMAIVTSGDYERSFLSGGKRYHHILDPRTGFPAEGMMSVTVMGISGLLSDALATGLFVMGTERGLQFVEDLDGVEAVLIDSMGNTTLSSGIASVPEFLPILSHRICSGKSCN